MNKYYRIFIYDNNITATTTCKIKQYFRPPPIATESYRQPEIIGYFYAHKSNYNIYNKIIDIITHE